MKVFLVPVDFSKNSDNALDYAVELARKEKSKILLLHILNTIHSISGIIGLMITEDLEEIEKITAEKLKKRCDEISKTQNIKCEYIYKTGDVIKTILETIDDVKPHMVIMGTRGAKGIWNGQRDSYTAKLIKQTKFPLMAIPENYKCNDLRKITFVTNYHANDIHALKLLIETAKPFKAQINSIHVADIGLKHESEMGKLKDFSDYISRRLCYNNLSFQLIKGESVEDEIYAHAEASTTNMLALPHDNQELLCRNFGNNITKKMLYNNEVPLMVINYN